MRTFSVRPALALDGRTFTGVPGWSGQSLPAGTYLFGSNVETADDHPVRHTSASDVFSGQHDEQTP